MGFFNFKKKLNVNSPMIIDSSQINVNEIFPLVKRKGYLEDYPVNITVDIMDSDYSTILDTSDVLMTAATPWEAIDNVKRAAVKTFENLLAIASHERYVGANANKPHAKFASEYWYQSIDYPSPSSGFDTFNPKIEDQSDYKKRYLYGSGGSVDSPVHILNSASFVASVMFRDFVNRIMYSCDEDLINTAIKESDRFYRGAQDNYFKLDYVNYADSMYGNFDEKKYLNSGVKGDHLRLIVERLGPKGVNSLYKKSGML